MRLLFSVSTFAFTMLISLVIFTYMLIETPTTMRSLISAANYLRTEVTGLGVLPDSYMVWADVLLQTNQIVLVGISIVVRIVIALFTSIFGSRSGSETPVADGPERSRSGSPFTRWG